MKIHTLITAALLVAPVAGFAADAAKSAEKPAPADATAKAPQGYKNIKFEEFEKMRTQPDTVVLDVRTKGEFDKGHVPGAVNLDFRSADFEKAAAKLDKSKTYLVHCAAGVRSLKACDKMAPLKFDKLFNYTGGYGEWMIKGGK